MELRYNPDNTFKILQFTDTHLGVYPYTDEDKETFQLIENALEKIDADLIIHTGDIIWSDGVENSDLVFKDVMTYFDKKKKPMAITFGNHDAEGTVSRAELTEIFEETVTNKAKKTNTLMVNGRESYTLEILRHDSDEVENILYVMDSGEDAPLPIGTYDWNQPEQVEWFRKISAEYRKGDNVKRNLVFQHIPVPEYWEAAENKLTGVQNENVSAPYLNTGLFANMVMDGETWGMFVGHDHDNNYDGLVHGIHLVFGIVGGYGAYGDLNRGVRMIELNANTNEIKTYAIEAHEFI